MALTLKRVSPFCFGSARTYTQRIDDVERRRDVMIERLAKWSGQTVNQVVQVVAGFIDPGRTFDETLYAIYHFHAFDHDRTIRSN